MPTAEQDTEITLGTGRMLVIFFAFVLVCAFFFSIGFSLGRRTASSGTGGFLNAAGGTPAAIVRPSAAKSETPQTAPQSSDFGFYKAVGEKSADAGLTPSDSKEDAKAQPAASTSAPAAATPSAATAAAEAPPKEDSVAGNAAPASGGYYVQVAAVSRKEDSEALVEALKKKQYPAFSANNPSTDKFYHVQVGPYGDVKEAEAMRARLIGDGYNPIVKK